MTEQQERELRMYLATLCMAAMTHKEGDLRRATEAVLEYVRNLKRYGAVG